MYLVSNPRSLIVDSAKITVNSLVHRKKVYAELKLLYLCQKPIGYTVRKFMLNSNCSISVKSPLDTP